MYTKQQISKDLWIVHYETILERYTKEFKSEKEADLYINSKS